LTSNSPRKHTETHGIFINHVDIFRVIPWLFIGIRAEVSAMGSGSNGTCLSDVIPVDFQ
jgi:hypothetical protein